MHGLNQLSGVFKDCSASGNAKSIWVSRGQMAGSNPGLTSVCERIHFENVTVLGQSKHINRLTVLQRVTIPFSLAWYLIRKHQK